MAAHFIKKVILQCKEGTLFYTLNIITLSISMPLTVFFFGENFVPGYTDNISIKACDRAPNKRQIKREISPYKKCVGGFFT